MVTSSARLFSIRNVMRHWSLMRMEYQPPSMLGKLGLPSDVAWHLLEEQHVMAAIGDLGQPAISHSCPPSRRWSAQAEIGSQHPQIHRAGSVPPSSGCCS